MTPEHAARPLGDLLVQAVEGMLRPMFVLDDAWRFAYVNPAGAQVLGRTVEDLLGRDIWAEFPEAVGGPFDQLYREVRRTGEAGASGNSAKMSRPSRSSTVRPSTWAPAGLT